MTFFSQSEIEIRLDPRVEVLSIVQFLSPGWSEIGPDRPDFPYVQDVLRMFHSVRDHPATAMVEKFRQGGPRWSLQGVEPVDWVLRLSYPEFECQVDPPLVRVRRAGGRTNLDQLARALHHFVQDSMYREFRSRHQYFYEETELALLDRLQPWQFMGEVESLFGIRGCYRVALCPLYGPAPLWSEIRSHSEIANMVIRGPGSIGPEGQPLILEEEIPRGILLPLVRLVAARFLVEEGAPLVLLGMTLGLGEKAAWTELLADGLALAALSYVFRRRGRPEGVEPLRAGASPEAEEVAGLVGSILEDHPEEDSLIRLIPEWMEPISQALRTLESGESGAPEDPAV